jgi:ligand-binding SRPBCC domain-containing protein
MHFSFEQAVPLAPERVFGFFENPQRLELLHAGWSRIRLLHHETQVRVGAETWLEVTIAGFIPIVLGFRHIVFEPPARFGEEAIHGPFSTFRHIHEFTPRNGDTVVHDRLEVRLPWKYGGEAVLEHGVAPSIRKMFLNRAQALTRLVNDGTLRTFEWRPIPANET